MIVVNSKPSIYLTVRLSVQIVKWLAVRVPYLSLLYWLGLEFSTSSYRRHDRCRKPVCNRRNLSPNWTRLAVVVRSCTALRVLYCYVSSVLLYRCETWTISETMKERLRAVEMWFLRRMLKIS